MFPNELHPVNERNLAITTGLGNLLAVPFGGYPMCHGARGLAGHVRSGARTATAPVLIGFVIVTLGIGFGASGYALLKTIPNAVLGALLPFSGIELALSSRVEDSLSGFKRIGPGADVERPVRAVTAASVSVDDNSRHDEASRQSEGASRHEGRIAGPWADDMGRQSSAEAGLRIISWVAEYEEQRLAPVFERAQGVVGQAQTNTAALLIGPDG